MTTEFRSFNFTFPELPGAVRNILPGITDFGEYICFAVDAPSSEEAKLSLYSPDSARLLSRIPMKRVAPEGDVFAVLVKKSECLGLTYSYFGANGIIEEPYAYKIEKRRKKQENGENGTPCEGGAPCENGTPCESGAPCENRTPFENRNNRESRKPVVFFPKYNWTDENRPHYKFSELIIYKLHVRGFSMEDADCKKSDKLLSGGSGEGKITAFGEGKTVASCKVKTSVSCESKITASAKRKKTSGQNCLPGTFGALTGKIGYFKELGINSVLLMPIYEFDDEKNYWGYGARSDYFCIKSSYASERGSASEEFMEMVNSLHRAGIEVMMEMSFEPETGINFIASCLRFYSSVYHIDGFRFMSFVPEFDILTEDPYLRHVKLINYGIGEKSAARCSKSRNLAVCNSDFQIPVRRFLKADEEQVEAFRDSIKRNPKDFARVNYITDADGFTLNDLYSYDVKNNYDNGEDNRDGCGKNYSWNCGAEGPQKTAKIKALRMSMYKNALSVLLLSQGTPMLLAGDEFLNSQLGNNNAYCQDNRISWLDWNTNSQSRELFDFLKKLIAFRKANPIISDVIEYAGSECVYHGIPKLSFHGIRPWYPDYGSWSRTLGIMFNSDGRHYYLVYNMHWEEHEFEIPQAVDNHSAVKSAFTGKKAVSSEENAASSEGKAGTPDENAVTYNIIVETGVRKCKASGGRITVPPRSAVLLEII